MCGGGRENKVVKGEIVARKIGNIFTRMWELLVGGKIFSKKNSHFFDPPYYKRFRAKEDHIIAKKFLPISFRR